MKAEIEIVEGFSAHADLDELLGWYDSLGGVERQTSWSTARKRPPSLWPGISGGGERSRWWCRSLGRRSHSGKLSRGLGIPRKGRREVRLVGCIFGKPFHPKPRRGPA